VQPVVKKLYRLKEMKENLYVIEEAIRKSSWVHILAKLSLFFVNYERESVNCSQMEVKQL
jgi:hypothetical protein